MFLVTFYSYFDRLSKTKKKRERERERERSRVQTVREEQKKVLIREKQQRQGKGKGKGGGVVQRRKSHTRGLLTERDSASHEPRPLTVTFFVSGQPDNLACRYNTTHSLTRSLLFFFFLLYTSPNARAPSPTSHVFPAISNI